MIATVEEQSGHEPKGAYLSEEEYKETRLKQLQQTMSTYMKMKRNEENLSDGRRRWFNQEISKNREEIQEVMEEIEEGEQ